MTEKELMFTCWNCQKETNGDCHGDEATGNVEQERVGASILRTLQSSQ